MKKICFSERYGLHGAVLERRKTHTRRLIPASVLDKVADFRLDYYEATFDNLVDKDLFDQYFFVEKIGKLPYTIGEEVAIAQRYGDILNELENPKNYSCMEHWEADAPKRAHYAGLINHPAFNNKMFVRPEDMLHTIRFNKRWIERLQDISDEDCIKEGIEVMESFAILSNGEKKTLNYYRVPIFCPSGRVLALSGSTPREVYARLINRISGKGTWESNPFVFAYEFELVK